MKHVEYQRMYEQESEHWWFVGKRHLLQLFIEWFADGSTRPIRILDVGCGTGRTLQDLARYGEVTGCDFNPVALAFCRQRGSRSLVQGSAEALPFVPDRFDMVCLLDVLYHRGITSDENALAQAFRVLRPGGILIVTDSAFQFLFGHHDRAAHGRQRYERREMQEKLVQAGFQVEKCGYFNFFIFLPALLVRLIKNHLSSAAETTDIRPTLSWINTFLGSLLRLEHWFIRWVSFPFGLSIFAIARKPVDIQQ